MNAFAHRCGILITLLIAGVLSAVPGYGQTAGTDEFRSISGGFGIKLPRTYSSYKQFVNLQIANQRLLISTYRWDLPFGQFSVSHGSDPFLRKPEQAKGFLENLRATFIAQGGKLVRQSEVDLQAHPGTELTLLANALVTVTRFFVVEGRLLIITATLNSTQRADSQPATAALDSIRLLPPDVITDELHALVATMSPSPLPQEPAAVRPTNDAQDERYKGSVKTVVEMKQEAIDNNDVGTPWLFSEREFNASGNLTSYVEYGNGLPSTIIVYGYVNGQRAARMMRKGLDLVLISDKSIHPDAAPKTQVHELLIKYKYDANGHLEEKRVVFGNGQEFEKISYDLKNNKTEQTGGLGLPLDRSKSTYLYDADGNPSKRIATSTVHEPYSAIVAGQTVKSDRAATQNDEYIYKYEGFDSHGNWTKRSTSHIEKKNGKDVEVLWYVTTRQLSYY